MMPDPTTVVCDDVVRKMTEAQVPFVVYACADVDDVAFDKGE